MKESDGEAAGFRPDEAFARELDDADSLAGYRSRFELPAGTKCLVRFPIAADRAE